MSYSPNPNPQWFQQDCYLAEGAYITSPGNLFYLALQTDGNFVMRAGTPSNPGPVVWASNVWTTGPYQVNFQSDGNIVEIDGNGSVIWQIGWADPSSSGPYFVQLFDDSSLNLFAGWQPPASGAALRSMGPFDPPVSFTPQTVQYDLSQATSTPLPALVVGNATLENDTSVDQSMQLTWSQTVEESISFSAETSISVSATLSVGLPIFDGTSFEVSATYSATFSTSETQTSSETFSYNAPVTVPPESTVDVQFSISQAAVSVPYTATGNFVLRSGYQVAGEINGTYSGANGYDLRETISPVQTLLAVPASQPTVTTDAPANA